MKMIKRLFMFLGTIFLIICILVVSTFIFVKHLKIKEIVEKEIENSLGIEVTIENIELSPLLTHIRATGVTIHNPAGFPEDELAYIKSIDFVFDPIEILTRVKPSVYVFALDLERLNIIKNSFGQVNIEQIIPVKYMNASNTDKTPFYFDIIVLSVGQIRYADYTHKVKEDKRYLINMKYATFIGLKDEQDVVKMVVSKAIENTDIGKLINLKIKPVASQIGDTMSSAWSTAKSGGRSAWSIMTFPFKAVLGN